MFELAYNLANFLRRLAVPKRVGHLTLTPPRGKLISIGMKVARRSGKGLNKGAWERFHVYYKWENRLEEGRVRHRAQWLEIAMLHL